MGSLSSTEIGGIAVVVFIIVVLGASAWMNRQKTKPLPTRDDGIQEAHQNGLASESHQLQTERQMAAHGQIWYGKRRKNKN
jgi:hypothetical protein